MKSRAGYALAASCALSLISLSAPAHADYKFLFLAQQTGPNGSIGESMRDGAQVALDEINASGGNAAACGRIVTRLVGGACVAAWTVMTPRFRLATGAPASAA